MTTKRPEKPTGKATTPADAAKANAARRAAAQEKAATAAQVVEPQPKAAPEPAPEPTPKAAPKAAAAKPRVERADTPNIKAAPIPRSGTGWLVAELRTTLEEGKKDVAAVRRRLRITYAIVVLFTVALFALGMALVGFPALSFYRDEIDELAFGSLAAAGAVALGLLLYFRPLDRLQALVADSTYVALVKDSFQYQVALRLIALDTDDTRSVERAAEYVGEAAQASMDLVYTQMQARRAAGFSAGS